MDSFCLLAYQSAIQPFLVSSRKLLLGGALRDDPKNGCVVDYLHIGLP